MSGAASASLPSAEELLSKRVQELVLDPTSGEHHLYVCRKVEEEAGGNPESPGLIIPVIDVGAIVPPDNSSNTFNEHERAEELQKLRSALSSWGCFQATGHGISECLMDNLREVAREFFRQPMNEKMKVAKGVEEFEGYGADPVPAKGQPLDWSDRLFLEVYPTHRRNPRFWPDTPASFSKAAEEYMKMMKKLTEQISRAMALSLNLEEGCFLEQFGEEALLQARLNYYSPCSRPDLVMGLKAHSDGSGYTVILQDDGVEGLQVLNEGKWITVPSMPHALLVLMGDQMEIMSNGEFRSPVHRVLTNSDKERISIAVFYTPETGKEIHPEEGLIDGQRPVAYKTMKDYADMHWGYYQQGTRAIHVAKV